MPFDLVEPLPLQHETDLADPGASAGTGEVEGSFERGGDVHPLDMGASGLKS